MLAAPVSGVVDFDFRRKEEEEGSDTSRAGGNETTLSRKMVPTTRSRGEGKKIQSEGTRARVCVCFK